MSRQETDPNELAKRYVCPTCSAPRGETCHATTNENWKVRPHETRLALVRNPPTESTPLLKGSPPAWRVGLVQTD